MQERGFDFVWNLDDDAVPEEAALAGLLDYAQNADKNVGAFNAMQVSDDVTTPTVWSPELLTHSPLI